MGRQRRAYTEDIDFLFSFVSCCESKTKTGITDRISIFLFCFWIRKKGKENLSFSYFLLWNRKTKKERTVYTAYGVFRVTIFILPKEKNYNMYSVSYFYFLLFVCGLGNRKRTLSYPFFYFFLLRNRKTKNERQVYTQNPLECQTLYRKCSILL